jgi:aspartyl-tRNA(Asn)/glutamyl-tRNA(Gln) amidotransferase subunit C
MKFDKEQVRKLAKLCRLGLSDAELESFSGELSDILGYVGLLSEVDTEGVPETAQVTGLHDVVREDVVDMELCQPDELLEVSTLPKQDNQIRINRMM